MAYYPSQYNSLLFVYLPTLPHYLHTFQVFEYQYFIQSNLTISKIKVTVTQENNGKGNLHGQLQGPQHRRIRGLEREREKPPAIRITESPTDSNTDYYNLIFKYQSKQKTIHTVLVWEV